MKRKNVECWGSKINYYKVEQKREKLSKREWKKEGERVRWWKDGE
jgi:hypothetical protein